MSGAGEFSGTIAAGRYRLGRALGGGRVHEARHDRVGGRFALERFGDVDARAFLRGAQQAAALRHPGIVRVLDYGTSPEAFIVMEWAEGRPLTDLLAARGALAPGEIAHLVESVALGLQAAHRQGLAHGHLTPAHILVTDEAGGSGEALGGARTKLLGFGTGPTGALAPAVSLTEVTPYEAPESLDGEPTPLADQYSLAAITYELLTGEAPRADGRPPRSVREYDPTINVVIDDVVRRGLSVNPHARWPDVHTFAARLGEAALAEGVLEEKTRLAPLPLTVTKPMTPAPDDLTPIELPPVIASIDVDLRTPAPARRAPSFLEGEISMNPTHTRPPSSDQGLPGGPYPTRYPSRGPAPPHYGIRPTPTFNFTDEPAPGPLYKPRRRSGSGFGLFVLVLAGGVSGYLAVDTGVWRRAEPLIARGKELGRSLKTLVPGASPEPEAAAAAPAASPAPTTATAPSVTPAPSVAAAAAPAPAAPSLPEVVPIAPAPARASAEHGAVRHAARAHHPRAHVGAGEHAPRGLSDEAATEEALLAPP